MVTWNIKVSFQGTIKYIRELAISKDIHKCRQTWSIGHAILHVCKSILQYHDTATIIAGITENLSHLIFSCDVWIILCIYSHFRTWGLSSYYIFDKSWCWYPFICISKIRANHNCTLLSIEFRVSHVMWFATDPTHSLPQISIQFFLSSFVNIRYLWQGNALLYTSDHRVCRKGCDIYLYNYKYLYFYH